jgi:uncharacterized RDD family membrane protein YckC
MSSPYGPGTLFCSECGKPNPPDELAHFGNLLICPACKDSYAQKLREGVAPVVAVEYAGFWIRVVASVIDWVILLIVEMIVQYAIFRGSMKIPQVQPSDDPGQVLAQFGALIGAIGLLSAINTAVNCAYEAIFVAKMQATPGKMALGLKVVRPDGSAVGLGRAAGRYFAKILSALILMIGYIMVAFDAQKRGLHDMICDTRVIKSRG